MPQFRERGAVVLGVSKDSLASRKKFEQTHMLPHPVVRLEVEGHPGLRSLEGEKELRQGHDGRSVHDLSDRREQKDCPRL